MSEPIVEIPIESISVDWDWNSRKGITKDSVAALALSIEEEGLEVPVVVRPDGDGYSLVCGFRRIKAFMVLGKPTIPCFIREMTDYEARLANFRENGEREQLTFWEEIMFVKNTFPKTCGMGEIQKEMNKTYDWLRPRRQIWDLPQIIIDYTEEGIFTAHNVNELLKRDPAQQEAAARAAEKARRRGESPRGVRKTTLIRRHVQGRKNMSRMMNIVADNSLCSDPRLNDLLLWAMGDIDKEELAARLEVRPELFLAIEE